MKIEKIKQAIKDNIEGKIVADWNENGHFYILPSGKRVASVTTKILLPKPHLLPWSIKQGVEWLEVGDRWQKLKDPATREEYMTGAQLAYTEVRDDAGSVGTKVHNIAEEYIKEWLVLGHKPVEDIRDLCVGEKDSRVWAGARAVEQLFIKHDIVPIASEILVGADKYESAGTLDFLCMWNGELTLADFKTSNSAVNDAYCVQVVAYAEFFRLMTGIRIKQIKIIKLSKDDDRISIYKINGYKEALRVFKYQSLTYDWLKNGIPKVERDVNKIKL